MEIIKRKYSIGAELIPSKGVHFRVWAPDHRKVELVLKENKLKPRLFVMDNEKNGYFSLLCPQAKINARYYFKLPHSKDFFPDPASRYQPEGSYGPSSVVDIKFDWQDKEWRGVSIDNQIIYEMHIGTFTKEGTFRAASKKLLELAKLGITLIEVMPINNFPGRFGWGYDGVNLFAPYHLYGKSADVKTFIDKAHSLGIGVILDVVYNHLGPEANYLFEFSKKYINTRHTTDWGNGINFDLPGVREFFLSNARYWIEEYHFDGLRIDDTSSFFCTTEPHILKELVFAAKKSGGNRNIIIIGENEPQDTRLLQTVENGAHGFDALWNDDFHHTSLVRLLGKREAYYTDYIGSPQEFISLIKYGFLYQGQYYNWQKKNRGVANFNISKPSMIIFLENHDQLGNTLDGRHLYQISELGMYKALTAFFLLSPNTLMLFQGQEYGAITPFLYFADHSQELNQLISEGRKEFLSQFPRLATEEIIEMLKNPSDPKIFKSCKLNHEEKNKNSIYSLHKDLINLRKSDAVFKKMQHQKLDGAILGPDSFLIRYFDEFSGDRMLIINFGPDFHLNPMPEPLLAPKSNFKWQVLWSSESPVYGGSGTPPFNLHNLKILGHSAIVLKSTRKE